MENRGRPVGLYPGVSRITLNQGAPRGQAQAEGELPAESCLRGHRRTLGRRRLQGGGVPSGGEEHPAPWGHAAPSVSSTSGSTVGGAEADGSEKAGTQICMQRPQLSRSSSCGGTETLQPPPTGPHRPPPSATERPSTCPGPTGAPSWVTTSSRGAGGTSRSLVSLGSGHDARVWAERAVARVCLALSGPPTLARSLSNNQINL